MRTKLSNSRYSRHVIRLGEWLIEFESISDIPVLGVGRMTLLRAPISCEVN